VLILSSGGMVDRMVLHKKRHLNSLTLSLQQAALLLHLLSDIGNPGDTLYDISTPFRQPTAATGPQMPKLTNREGKAIIPTFRLPK
jgi:hypothetical protein